MFKYFKLATAMLVTSLYWLPVNVNAAPSCQEAEGARTANQAAARKIGFFRTGEAQKQDREACTAVAIHEVGVVTEASCVFKGPGTSNQGNTADLHQQPFFYFPLIPGPNAVKQYSLEYKGRIRTRGGNIAVLQVTGPKRIDSGSIAPIATFHPSGTIANELDPDTGKIRPNRTTTIFRNTKQIFDTQCSLRHFGFPNFDNRAKLKRISLRDFKFETQARSGGTFVAILPNSPFAGPQESGTSFVRGAPYLIMEPFVNSFRSYLFGMTMDAQEGRVMLINARMAEKIYELLPPPSAQDRIQVSQ